MQHREMGMLCGWGGGDVVSAAPPPLTSSIL